MLITINANIIIIWIILHNYLNYILYLRIIFLILDNNTAFKKFCLILKEVKGIKGENL